MYDYLYLKKLIQYFSLIIKNDIIVIQIKDIIELYFM